MVFLYNSLAISISYWNTVTSLLHTRVPYLRVARGAVARGAVSRGVQPEECPGSESICNLSVVFASS